MSKPIEQIAALTIGTVESVSPSEIKVLLEPNAPQATALNTGVPTGFPRINGYVLIPNETGAVVGLVVWLGVERSQFPKRTGLKDFGLVDLPFPLRKISLTPLGTLLATKRAGGGENAYRLERGVSAFPSVGDAAQLPTAEQLRSIIEASSKEDRRVKIGTSPLAANATVTVDPDKIFGRHLAVLGNTGSGKSCTVAGLIRWSLEKARKERARLLKEALETAQELGDTERENEAAEKHRGPPNARFIILDPNGEYSSAFADCPGVRRFTIPPAKGGTKDFCLPAWMWNSHEWCAFTQAKSGVQRPVLMRALRELRTVSPRTGIDRIVVLTALLRSYHRSLVNDRNKGAIAFIDKPGKNDFGQKLHAIARSLMQYADEDDLSKFKDILSYTGNALKRIADDRHKTFTNEAGEMIEYYQAFDSSEVENAVAALDKCIESIPDVDQHLGINEDSPIPFAPSNFAELIEQIAAEQGQSQYVDTLVLRVKMLLSDMRLMPVLTPTPDISLEEWLNQFIGSGNSGTFGIIDLSLISSDVLHLVIAVVARIVFEATQRYRKLNDQELPTVLVLEEAHTFVRRGSDEESDTPTPSHMCRQTFERIAREGRKFGLGLVLSSQRPSELSPTVLAQCNTFILHRIVNDRDQELVSKLVPDNLGGLLKELPSLPSRQAILLGWAATVPTLVEITELPEDHRPRSSDPKFWDVWTGEEDRPINWREIVENWTGTQNKPTRPSGPSEEENAT
ncbi:MAG: DUF87 domain-containing protein [Deltaproteobacteria bacterium]|nr:DUF87 domain-containing protein [Deltaproteobacteria bacterium]